MTRHPIADWRLHTQHLTGPPAATEADVVGDLLGVQAENHAQASWAVGSRARSATSSSFAAAFDAGTILRTHVLRSTWHFVRPDDIRWLLDLTGPRIRPAFRTQLRALDRDAAALDRATGIVVDAIAQDGPLTRARLGDRLRDHGSAVDGQRLMLIAAHAELAGLICSGPLADDAHTYALLADRAPHARRLERPEALAEIALRYFRGHGPATERDLAYWATLTLGDVRAGLAMVADQLESFELDGRTFWSGTPKPRRRARPRAHLLQIFDEYYRGYQDSRSLMDVDGLTDGGREPSTGMVLLDGQYAGKLRRTVNRSTVAFDLDLGRPITDDERTDLDTEAARYGRFLGLESRVRRR